MIQALKRKRKSLLFRSLCLYVLISFISTMIVPSASFAQSAAGVLNLPAVGSMVTTTPAYSPALMRGLMVHPEDALKFDFIVEKGDSTLQGEAFKTEANKLIKYFLAALTVPEQEMWVNLSPYEKDRIIPQHFGRTEMGRDLLAQDYLLKQITASLMYPEKDIGDAFWRRVHEQVKQKFGSVDIPMNTFNKIWIVPSEASVFENEKGAFIVKTSLRVLLDEDYLALEANKNSNKHGLGRVKKEELVVVSGVQSQVIKEILIPEIEKEVNQGKTFANLRQIYNSVILANWYKNALRESLLGKVYVNQAKTKGVEAEDQTVNEKIYKQYVEAFEKGVYNYIKEEYDPGTQAIIPRKYFSGGVNYAMLTPTKSASAPTSIENAMLISAAFTGFGQPANMSRLTIRKWGAGLTTAMTLASLFYGAPVMADDADERLRLMMNLYRMADELEMENQMAQAFPNSGIIKGGEFDILITEQLKRGKKNATDEEFDELMVSWEATIQDASKKIDAGDSKNVEPISVGTMQAHDAIQRANEDLAEEKSEVRKEKYRAFIAKAQQVKDKGVQKLRSLPGKKPGKKASQAMLSDQAMLEETDQNDPMGFRRHRADIESLRPVRGSAGETKEGTVAGELIIASGSILQKVRISGNKATLEVFQRVMGENYTILAPIEFDIGLEEGKGIEFGKVNPAFGSVVSRWKVTDYLLQVAASSTPGNIHYKVSFHAPLKTAKIAEPIALPVDAPKIIKRAVNFSSVQANKDFLKNNLSKVELSDNYEQIGVESPTDFIGVGYFEYDSETGLLFGRSSGKPTSSRMRVFAAEIRADSKFLKPTGEGAKNLPPEIEKAIEEFNAESADKAMISRKVNTLIGALALSASLTGSNGRFNYAAQFKDQVTRVAVDFSNANTPSEQIMALSRIRQKAIDLRQRILSDPLLVDQKTGRPFNEDVRENLGGLSNFIRAMDGQIRILRQGDAAMTAARATDNIAIIRRVIGYFDDSIDGEIVESFLKGEIDLQEAFRRTGESANDEHDIKIVLAAGWIAAANDWSEEATLAFSGYLDNESLESVIANYPPFGQMAPEELQAKKERALSLMEKQPPGDSAMTTTRNFTKGGIDMNPDIIKMNSQREGNGIKIPIPAVPEGNWNNIEGFIPNIINVTPVTNLPLLLGVATPEPKNNDTEVSYNLSSLSPALKEEYAIKEY